MWLSGQQTQSLPLSRISSHSLDQAWPGLPGSIAGQYSSEVVMLLEVWFVWPLPSNLSDHRVRAKGKRRRG